VLLFVGSERKIVSHPGRPSWIRIVICQIGGHEAIALGLVSPEAPPVACTICQGTYDPDAPGTIAFTIHTDCGNGCAPPSDACDMARGHPPPTHPPFCPRCRRSSLAEHRICTACEKQLLERYESVDVAPCPWCMKPLRIVRRGEWRGQVV